MSMKKLDCLITFRLFLSILVVMLSCRLYADGLEKEDAGNPTRFAKEFLTHINLDSPDMKEPARFAGRGDYTMALETWRNHVVRKLRALDLGEFNWHGYQTSLRKLNLARRIAGRMTEAEYRTTEKGGNWKDIYGLCGLPGKTGKINWLATYPDPRAKNTLHYGDFWFATSLSGMYWKNKDPVYLQKWLELTSDFVRNQKREIEKLDPRQRKVHACNWSTDAGAALGQAWRVENIIKTIAVFAKCLTDSPEQRPWDDVLKPAKGEITFRALAQIPPKVLAEIAASLVLDHPEALMKRYLEPGAVPNQRLHGLYAVAMISRIFSEFKEGPTLARAARNGLLNYIATTTFPDGGDLEQSFNYNAGLFGKIANIENLYRPNPPAWVGKLREAGRARLRLFAGMQIPTGRLPRIGTSSYSHPGAIWKDKKAEARWKTEQFKRLADRLESNPDPLVEQINIALFGDGSKGTPPFTSVAFPYSGYYAMRTGWSVADLYLSLIAPRIGRGHYKENINSVCVTAYGRHLLVADGPPPYRATNLPDDQMADYNQIKEYLGEKSPFGSNTILVDGQGQRRHRMHSHKHGYIKPIAARRHASEFFDLAEGSYTEGYGGGKKYSPAPIKAEHLREVVFVREAKLWIITDRLRADGNREFEQMWNFPPAVNAEGKPNPGFTRDQVVTNEKEKTIRTADPHGPNVALYHFTGSPLHYVKYYGRKNPYMGWYSFSINGRKVPAVDVHAKWKGKGSQLLVTVIVPMKGPKSPVDTVEDLSAADGARCGFRMRMKDGLEVVYLAALDKRNLKASGLSATCEGLLVTRDTKEIARGICLGCEELTSDAGKISSENFEFELARGKLRIVSPIRKPTGFKWVNTERGPVPSYN